MNTLIALSALAMGLQSALVRSLGIAGIATTYITGCVAKTHGEHNGYDVSPLAQLMHQRQSPAPQPRRHFKIAY